VHPLYKFFHSPLAYEAREAGQDSDSEGDGENPLREFEKPEGIKEIGDASRRQFGGKQATDNEVELIRSDPQHHGGHHEGDAPHSRMVQIELDLKAYAFGT
jgi:hypothetical protein